MSKNDFSIQPAGLPEHKAPGKILPTYLISIDGGKKDSSFLATKLDDLGHCVKCVGFYTQATTDTVVSTYEELIKTTDANQFIEILIPWHRINYIRSLMYRHRNK